MIWWTNMVMLLIQYDVNSKQMDSSCFHQQKIELSEQAWHFTTKRVDLETSLFSSVAISKHVELSNKHGNLAAVGGIRQIWNCGVMMGCDTKEYWPPLVLLSCRFTNWVLFVKIRTYVHLWANKEFTKWNRTSDVVWVCCILLQYPIQIN